MVGPDARQYMRVFHAATERYILFGPDLGFDLSLGRAWFEQFHDDKLHGETAQADLVRGVNYSFFVHGKQIPHRFLDKGEKCLFIIENPDFKFLPDNFIDDFPDAGKDIFKRAMQVGSKI